MTSMSDLGKGANMVDLGSKKSGFGIDTGKVKTVDVSKWKMSETKLKVI